jgi:hypothetical protein
VQVTGLDKAGDEKVRLRPLLPPDAVMSASRQASPPPPEGSYFVVLRVRVIF